MDAATPRVIRIGKVSVGLIGLDNALNSIARQQVDEQEAVHFPFAEISRDNYIPSGSEEKYRQALLEVYRRHCGAEAQEDTALVIRIFGTGCVSCNSLQTLVLDILDRLQLAADIEQIYDPDEIGRSGITMTPALMINGTVKSTGRQPLPIQVEQWIREAAGV